MYRITTDHEIGHGTYVTMFPHREALVAGDSWNFRFDVVLVTILFDAILEPSPGRPVRRGPARTHSAYGFFKCIQKVFEVLMDPVRRRQFDSVDAKANVLPPNKSQKDFIQGWSKVFDAEARFSKVSPVPSLGTMESPKSEVDAFYTFFYAFDSWRSFEYLDEDVPDDTSNRDNKRHIEKKNKAARQKHKSDDIARLRKLVDDALAQDPRIKMYKEAERKAKKQRK